MYIQLIQSIGMGKGGGSGDEKKREKWQAGRSKHFPYVYAPECEKGNRLFLQLQVSNVPLYLAMLTLTVEFNGN